MKTLEERRAYNKKWRRQYNESNCNLKRKYADFKYYDKKYGRQPPDFTYEELLARLSIERCVYCGSTVDLGLDRIDNSKGHIKGNTVVSCHICNITRGDNFTVEEFKKVGKVLREISKLRKGVREVLNR